LGSDLYDCMIDDGYLYRHFFGWDILKDILGICLMSAGVIEDMHLLAMACTFILIRLDLSVSCVQIYTRMEGHVIKICNWYEARAVNWEIFGQQFGLGEICHGDGDSNRLDR